MLLRDPPFQHQEERERLCSGGGGGQAEVGVGEAQGLRAQRPEPSPTPRGPPWGTARQTLGLSRMWKWDSFWFHVVSCDWLLSFSIMFSRFLCVGA